MNYNFIAFMHANVFFIISKRKHASNYEKQLYLELLKLN